MIEWIRMASDAKDSVGAIVGWVGSIAGVFLGAWLAFHFERRKRDEERREAKIEAGSAAIHSLGRMLTVMISTKETLADPFKDSPKAWWDMPTLIVLPAKVRALDMRELAFLLCTDNLDDANALELVAVAEYNYNAAVDHIVERNRRKDEATTLLSSAHVPGKLLTEQDIQEILKVKVISGLKGSTQGMIKALDKAIPDIHAALKELKSALERSIEKHTFLTPVGIIRPA